MPFVTYSRIDNEIYTMYHMNIQTHTKKTDLQNDRLDKIDQNNNHTLKKSKPKDNCILTLLMLSNNPCNIPNLMYMIYHNIILQLFLVKRRIAFILKDGKFLKLLIPQVTPVQYKPLSHWHVDPVEGQMSPKPITH